MKGPLMLAFTQHVLPFLGAAIGTYMLFRMAFVERKLRTNPLVILAGMAVEAISIGVGVYTTITNPDTTQAILGWTGVSILLGLLGPVLAGRLERALRPRDSS
jgi:ABC-type Fe3+-siderophore transport system permease subunit